MKIENYYQLSNYIYILEDYNFALLDLITKIIPKIYPLNRNEQQLPNLRATQVKQIPFCYTDRSVRVYCSMSSLLSVILISVVFTIVYQIRCTKKILQPKHYILYTSIVMRFIGTQKKVSSETNVYYIILHQVYFYSSC